MSNKAKLLIPIVGVALLIGYVALMSDWIDKGRKTSATSAGAAVLRADSFAGGTFEASGITHVAGTDGFLFVDDGRTGEVLWMVLDKGGKQAGSITPVRLGVDVDDPEGITTDGTYFYVVGSQSRSKTADQAGLVRFRFNKETKTAEDVHSISGLKRFLIENVAELHSVGSTKGSDDEIDIEGLAWDPDRRSILLGLRSPVIAGKALVVPLKMRDPRGTFSFENIEAGNLEPIRLPLAGMGIRSIEYAAREGVFYIIGGATEGQDKTDFKLWEWNGRPDGSGLREITTFDRKLQPEGVSSGDGDLPFKLIVFDGSRYLSIP
jgi:hypothetical protein